jgi:hypothetical protein
MPLETKVWMSPASGLAQVEFVPIDRDFLQGHRVFLDYLAMEDVAETELPKPRLASPPIRNIPVDPADSVIGSSTANRGPRTIAR